MSSGDGCIAVPALFDGRTDRTRRFDFDLLVSPLVSSGDVMLGHPLAIVWYGEKFSV